MTLLIAKDGCRDEYFAGQKRPRVCEHGFSLETVKVATKAPRKHSRKRSEPRRDWSLAIAKRQEEEDRCRVCGAHGTEAAHIMGRVHDQPISEGSRTLLVLPDRIVPLCPPCHRLHDSHQLELVGHLTTAEQAQAVLDAGSIGLALKRISPVQEERVA